MRPALLIAITTLALPAAAHGETLAGTWLVSGAILGHGFVLDCRFEPKGQALGGACIESGRGEGQAGKVHPLTVAGLTGNRATWAYPASAFFLKFEMRFEGTIAGDHIAGTASAAGRKGSFTAVRKQGAGGTGERR